jgi:16S rRNA (guanine966-N2)-methyltransferase
VLRIIAGQFRSRQIFQPDGVTTRATKDRVREGIFSALGSSVIEAKVLDLFAGSGAYAIEALSRGAQFIWLNDYEIKAYETIVKNIHQLKIQTAKITQLDARECLNKCVAENQLFDLIFIDPPYQSNLIQQTTEFIQTHEILKPNGILIIESETPMIGLPEANFKVKVYNYGRTYIHIAWKKN